MFPIDLLTCFGGSARGIRPGKHHLSRTTDYATPESRMKLLRLLRVRKYSMVGMICSGRTDHGPNGSG